MSAAFEDRLINWGMHYRPDRAKSETSPTYDVCLQIARERGQEIVVGFAESRAKPVIDVDDAKIIEWCWGKSRWRMDAKHWALLRAHYVMQHDRRILCRAMQIRFRSYDSTVLDAVRRFEQCVGMLEAVDNCAKAV